MTHLQLTTLFTKTPQLTLAIASCILWYLWSVILLLLCQGSECPEQPVQVAITVGMDGHSQSPPCWGYPGGVYLLLTPPGSLLNYAYVGWVCASQVVTRGHQLLFTVTFISIFLLQLCTQWHCIGQLAEFRFSFISVVTFRFPFILHNLIDSHSHRDFHYW